MVLQCSPHDLHTSQVPLKSLEEKGETGGRHHFPLNSPNHRLGESLLWQKLLSPEVGPKEGLLAKRGHWPGKTGALGSEVP